MKGRTPTKAEKAYMDKVCQLGCIICRIYHGLHNTYCSVHHIDGRTKENAHFNILALCGRHHQRPDNGKDYEAVHPYTARFEERYGKQSALLKRQNELLNMVGEWQDEFIDMSKGI